MRSLFIKCGCLLFMNMNFLFPLAESKPILLWITLQAIVYYVTDRLDRQEATDDKTDEGEWKMFR